MLEDIQRMNYIDLTHVITPEIATWDLTCGYHVDTVCDYNDSETEFKVRAQRFEFAASAGTHMDAPAHFIKGGATIDTIPVEQLVLPCVVIDVSGYAHERYSISVDDIKNFESQWGMIAAGSCVLFYTGWSKHWYNPKKYHNNHLFPSISLAVAQLLVEKHVVSIGIDTLSPDRPEDGFYVHNLWLGAGKYIIENCAHLEQLPPKGATLFVMPLLLQGATESPVRLVGIF